MPTHRDFLIQKLISTLESDIGPKGHVRRRTVQATVLFFKLQYEALLQRENLKQDSPKSNGSGESAT